MYYNSVAEAIADINKLDGYNLWAGECTNDALMVVDGLSKILDKQQAFEFIKFWVETVSVVGPRRGISVLALIRPDGEVLIEERIVPEKALKAISNVDRWAELSELQPEAV